MNLRKKPLDDAAKAKILADLRRDQEAHRNSYRTQALKLFPHVCGRCSREFSGKRLRELTVHHKDHNFRNNPPDGSNWELLCLYCHDHEHEKFRMEGVDGAGAGDIKLAPSIFGQFAALDSLIKPAPPTGDEKPAEPKPDASTPSSRAS